MSASANGISQPKNERPGMDPDAWIIMLRRPVKREGSGQYMVLILFSFALSVSLTRLYLTLSNYPRIESGELHFAHVLWGGLLLFFAALLSLLISNRTAYKVSAVLAGAGTGLFIDEVGKFITQRNDYFYPAAAPIIYIFFMLTLLLLLQMRREDRATDRAELCRILETLQDWIYSPLNSKDQVTLLERLSKISTSSNSEILASLAGGILSVVQSDQRPTPILRPSHLEIYSQRLDHWFSEYGLRVALAIGFLIMAVIAFKNPASAFLGSRLSPDWRSILFETHSGRWYGSELSPRLYQARVLLEIILGSLLFVNSMFLFWKKIRVGIPLGFVLLLLYLVTTDMLLFYFEQFSTIVFVIYQFLLLLGLFYYRTHFPPQPAGNESKRAI